MEERVFSTRIALRVFVSSPLLSTSRQPIAVFPSHLRRRNEQTAFTMASWFSDMASKLQEVSDQVTETAKRALPLDHDMMEKLTLTTPALAEERKRIDIEEKRKEHIKDCLAGMLPWETRDPERDILVEECKEAILKLSDDAATFQGPYRIPGMTVKLTENEDAEEENEGDEDDEDEEDNEAKKEDEEEKPSEESLDKLATLEPLPKLLGEFDLDAHVGLIQRLLSEDPDLVKMQSKLSGKHHLCICICIICYSFELRSDLYFHFLFALVLF